MKRRNFIKNLMGAVASVAVFGASTQLPIVETVPPLTLRVMGKDLRLWPAGVFKDLKAYNTIDEYNRLMEHAK